MYNYREGWEGFLNDNPPENPDWWYKEESRDEYLGTVLDTTSDCRYTCNYEDDDSRMTAFSLNSSEYEHGEGETSSSTLPYSTPPAAIQQQKQQLLTTPW